MLNNNYPRVVIGGLSGDSGKTVISCGLLSCLRERGIGVSAFKKGPDYIDSAWLSLSAGKPARNLDTFLMGFPIVTQSFLKHAGENDISIIEGNRGIFDGVDKQGTHSTAELAKSLLAPLIIVQNISKLTRTAAVSILGSKKLDPDLNIAGVILNQVAGERHGKVAKEAIEEITGIPVIGMIPKLKKYYILPARHLGLITPEEFKQRYDLIRDLRIIIEEHVDVSKIIELAYNAPILSKAGVDDNKHEIRDNNKKVKIGYIKDQSFSFYYPENLEALTSAGAELIPISAINDNHLEDLDGLYIGGGFPETNLTKLILNRKLMDQIKNLADEGLPIYAECGGLIYLAEDIEWKEKKYSLSSILPIKIKMFEKPQGHGYCLAVIDKENPFFKVGTIIKGHEFHYSKIYDYDKNLKSSISISRGVGCFNKRDGLIYKNTFATFIHIHALATPEWANGFINCSKKYNSLKKTKILIEA